jgi:hypothetical protein
MSKKLRFLMIANRQVAFGQNAWEGEEIITRREIYFRNDSRAGPAFPKKGAGWPQKSRTPLGLKRQSGAIGD